MAKLDMRNVVLSVTLFIAIAYVICRLFFWIIPEQSAAFSSYLFHGIKTEAAPMSLSGFVIGLIGSIILSIAGSALFVWIYNKVAKK